MIVENQNVRFPYNFVCKLIAKTIEHIVLSTTNAGLSAHKQRLCEIIQIQEA